MVSKYKRESILPAMIMVLSNFLLKKNQRGGSGSPGYKSKRKAPPVGPYSEFAGYL